MKKRKINLRRLKILLIFAGEKIKIVTKMEIYKAIGRWQSFVNAMSTRKGEFPKPRDGRNYVVEASDDSRSMEKLEDFLNSHLNLDRQIEVKHSWVSPTNKGGDGKRFYEIEGIPNRYYEWKDFVEVLELPNIKRRKTPSRKGTVIQRVSPENKLREKLTAQLKKQYPKVKENIIRQMVERDMARLSK